MSLATWLLLARPGIAGSKQLAVYFVAELVSDERAQVLHRFELVCNRVLCEISRLSFAPLSLAIFVFRCSQLKLTN
jgi:hypothetical protein